jgi:hypothetical protein
MPPPEWKQKSKLGSRFTTAFFLASASKPAMRKNHSSESQTRRNAAAIAAREVAAIKASEAAAYAARVAAARATNERPT